MFGPKGVNAGPLLSRKLSCEYSEYTTGITGTGGRLKNGGRVPVFEEMLRFLPKWTTVMEAADDLVKVLRSFSLQWCRMIWCPHSLSCISLSHT